MPSTSPEVAKASLPAGQKADSKNPKQSKIVTLKLSSYLLTQFPYEDNDPKPAEKTQTKSTAADSSKAGASSPVGKSEQSPSTPKPTTDSNGDTSTTKDGRRKGIPGPKPGQKRSAPTTEPDGTPKPKGKPGPKKRKVDGETGAPVPAPAPRLGPKANTGAINAQLRALDRTGKPCRRWAKRTVALKSFTGVAWDLPYWQSPKLNRDNLPADSQSQDTSSTEAKHEPNSSQVQSERSNADRDTGNVLNVQNETLDMASNTPEDPPMAESDSKLEQESTTRTVDAA